MMRNISIREDFHCHTDFSHGKNSAEQMIETAIELGLKTIAVTEHVRLSTPWFEEYFFEMECLKKKFRRYIKVLCGLEAKTINWSGDLDAEIGWCKQVDLVLGSIHSIPDNHGGYFEPNDRQPRKIVRHAWQKTLAGLFNNPLIKVIAHPFYELREYALPIDLVTRNLFMKLVTSSNKSIEISLKHRLLNKNILDKLLRANVRLIIGSDAHSVNELTRLHKIKNEIYV